MLSSTFLDLKEERSKAETVILGAGFKPEIMEHNGPLPGVDVITSSLEMVQDCSAYVLILASRYGEPPDDPVRNKEKLSLTELEFQYAEELDRPILVYVASDDYRPQKKFRERDELHAKLEAFAMRSKRIKGTSLERVYREFDDAQQFIRDFAIDIGNLKSNLEPSPLTEKFDEAGHQARVFGLPPAPKLAARPKYGRSHEFEGRVTELYAINSWCREADPKPMMVIDAIGGMGKSFLAWTWLEQHAPLARPDHAGRFWYSFYEGGTNMADFGRKALAYMEGADPGELNRPDLQDRLSDALEDKPWLFVLDGVERLLNEYNSPGAANMQEQEGDASAKGDIDPCAPFLDEDAELLRQLASCAPSKLLLTTRLRPSCLLNRTGNYIPDVEPKSLSGLSDDDALAMMRRQNITGSGARIQAFLRHACACHPLAIGAIAGLVLEYLEAPGDFDKWYDDQDHGGALNLADLDLKQRQNHILEYAVDVVDDASKLVLGQIVMLEHGATYNRLRGANPLRPARPDNLKQQDPNTPKISPAQLLGKRKKTATDPLSGKAASEGEKSKVQKDTTLAEWQRSDAVRAADRELDTAIRNLLRRGLILFSEGDEYYDLHPIVRSVVDQRTRADQRKAIGQTMIDHLTSVQRPPFEEATTLEDVQPGVDLVRMYQQTDAFDDAADYFTGKIFGPLFRRFDALMMLESMLKAFFPDDWFSTPHVSTVERHLSLLKCVFPVVRERDNQKTVELTYKALELALQAKLTSYFTDLIYSLSVFHHDEGKIAEFAALLDALKRLEDAESAANAFAPSERKASLRLLEALQVLCIEKQEYEDARVYFEELEGEDKKVTSGRCCNALVWRAICQLYEDELTLSDLQNYAEAISKNGRLRSLEFIYQVRGDWHMVREEYQEAQRWYSEAINMARRSGRRRHHSEASRCLARIRDEQIFDARGQVKNFEANGKADFTCAKIWKELGEIEKAKDAALRAHANETQDGHPFFNRDTVARIEDFLGELNVEPPEIVDHNPDLVRPYPWEPMVEQMLVWLDEERQKMEKRKERLRKQRKESQSKAPKIRPAATKLAKVKARSFNQLLDEVGGSFDQRIEEVKIDAKWPAEPLISGDWLELNASHVVELYKVACEKNAKILRNLDAVAARAIPLPFYKNGFLLEILLHSGDILYGTFRAILTKNFCVAIDGTSPSIHALNTKRLKFLNIQDRITYLHLFCSAVRGEEGRFRIVETLPDIGNLDGNIEVGPVTIYPSEENRKSNKFSAHVLYSSALFLADFEVTETGTIEMLDDKPLAADLDVDPEIFDSSGRIQLYDAQNPHN